MYGSVQSRCKTVFKSRNDQFHDPDPFSTMFENQLNISDDRSLENENQVAIVEDTQDEEIVLEPVTEKKNRQFSILDFYKKWYMFSHFIFYILYFHFNK